MKLIMHQMEFNLPQMRLIMHQIKFNLDQMIEIHMYQMKLNLH